ncbi:LysR family transcriptional regulator [Mycetocola reblochoni]|uniref:LysR family transcriptional regulator n=3 Tax=Mycetocola reblochoni TaxID=331618 RepID=A0A3L6ZJD0_9MICO|nr:LysR family transcriptional regulator [Mycetocola reblochoni]
MTQHHEMVDLQQLRYVVAVAEERSFTRAAERCFVVQSALSHRVKALESELGLTLFARSSRRVEPTPAGDAFVAQARASLAAADRAVRDASAADGRVTGTLTLGVIPTLTGLDLAELLGRFRAAHPGVRLIVRVGGSDEFVAAIASGTMDVALLGLPSSAGAPPVAHRELSRDRLSAVLPSDHRLAARKRLRLAELVDEDFVDFPQGTPGREQTDRAFADAGLSRAVPFEVMSVELMRDLIARGLAVGMLSPGAGGVPAAGATDEAVVALPVLGGPTRVEYLAWDGFNPSPAARAFLELPAV